MNKSIYNPAKISLKTLELNLASLFSAIEICLTNKFILPALVLIYSSIDIVASLERLPSEGTQSSFVRWVDKYLFKAKSLPCTAMELYAARCAIIHTMAAESKLSQQGKARPVYYAWGTAEEKDLQLMGNKVGRTNYVSMHVSDLSEAFRLGWESYLKDLDCTPERKKTVYANAGLWFTNLSMKEVESFLKIQK